MKRTYTAVVLGLLALAGVLVVLALAGVGCPPASPIVCSPAAVSSPATPPPPAPLASAPSSPRAASGSQGVGSVSGRVTVTRGVSRPQPVPVGKDADVCGKVYESGSLLLRQDGALENAVVFLKGQLPAWTPDVGAKFEIDQKGCHYAPHVLIAPANTPVAFLNSDSVLHNVTWTSVFNASPNLSVPSRGRTELAFKKPEILLLSCNVHSFMAKSGVLVVAEHRWYTVTDDSGSYSLAGVPPGKYKLFVWHEVLEKADKQGQPITVESGKNGVANVVFQ